MFTAVARGDDRAARRIAADHVEPAIASIVRRSVLERARQSERTLEYLDGQQLADEIVLGSAPISLLLVFAVITASSVSFKRRRHAEVEHEAELTRLERAALTDNLTGLRNHRSFHEDFARNLARRNRDGESLSLLMVDLDGLKETNDTFGHQAGDERIRVLADCLRDTLRTEDRAYRVGGDEFTVILPGKRAWTAFEIGQRLRSAAQERGAGIAVGVAEAEGQELKDEALWVLHHHERVDGTGYPHGLEGDQIPLESRIILVADTYEAITSDRPYRRGRTSEEALAELERHAGTQFDEACVAALRRGLRPATPG